MDKIDKKILDVLQSDAQISNQELADKVSLSPSPCSRRVKQLQDAGYIKQYVALLDRQKLNLSLMAIILVGLKSHAAEQMAIFEKKMSEFREVMECHLLTGQSADYLLKIAVADMHHFHDFLLKQLGSMDIVNTLNSNFILSSPVERTAFSLDKL